MGVDRVRHLLRKPLACGDIGYFWNPSQTLRDLGLTPEALGTDYDKAKSRAMELNTLADAIRRSDRGGKNSARPDTYSALLKAYLASDEFAELKPRTQHDYRYYMGKIELEFGHLPVMALTPRVIKTYYKRVRKEKGVTWSYHILSHFRTLLTWGVSEDWLDRNPALEVKMTSPKKRTIVWGLEQAEIYIAKARELGWHSVAVMAMIFDSIAQSPIDVRPLKRAAYDGSHISSTREKTGVTDAPIPLFPEAKAALDEYLAENPRLPEAPLFTHDRRGGEWPENGLQRVHRAIRRAAGLPEHLQLQDFRRTAQTEAGAAGGTVDEIRFLARHKTRSVGEHYVVKDPRFVESVQAKRLALRNKRGQ